MVGKIDQLVVVNFPDRGGITLPASQQNPRWHDRMFIVNTCSRNLLITTEDQWEKVPDDIRGRCLPSEVAADWARVANDGTKPEDYYTRDKKPYYRIERGEKAFGMLLHIAAGLDSSRRAEEQIHGQIMEQWKEYKQRDWNNARPLDGVMRDLQEYAKLIHSRIIQARVKPTFNGVAKRLSGSGPDDIAVIFASDAKDMQGLDLESLKELANALGKDNQGSVKEIIVLHPNPEVADKIRYALNQMSEEKQLVRRFSVIPVDFQNTDPEWQEAYRQEAADCVNKAKAVFVLQPMGKKHSGEASYDKFIMDCWNGRNLSSSPRNGKLVLIRDTAEDTTESVANWIKALREADQLVEPRQINGALTGERMAFNGIVHRAENAVQNCLISHRYNQHPDHKLLALPPAEYEAQFPFNKRFEPGKSPKLPEFLLDEEGKPGRWRTWAERAADIERESGPKLS